MVIDENSQNGWEKQHFQVFYNHEHLSNFCCKNSQAANTTFRNSSRKSNYCSTFLRIRKNTWRDDNEGRALGKFAILIKNNLSHKRYSFMRTFKACDKEVQLFCRTERQI